MLIKKCVVQTLTKFMFNATPPFDQVIDGKLKSPIISSDL